MIDDKNVEHTKVIKKVWSKPKLLSGKDIGFLGLGRVQTGTTVTPS